MTRGSERDVTPAAELREGLQHGRAGVIHESSSRSGASGPTYPALPSPNHVRDRDGVATAQGIGSTAPRSRRQAAAHALLRCLPAAALGSRTPTPPPLPPNQRQGRLLRDSHSWGISAGVRHPPQARVAPPGAYRRNCRLTVEAGSMPVSRCPTCRLHLTYTDTDTRAQGLGALYSVEHEGSATRQPENRGGTADCVS